MTPEKLYLGNSPTFEEYIAVQAYVGNGTQVSQQSDRDSHFSEWDFRSVRQASRFARELDNFCSPAIDSFESWSEALKKQIGDQNASTWTTEDEFAALLKEQQEGKTA